MKPENAQVAPDPSSLSDPVTCGEDLDLNRSLVAGLAARFCADCQGYHESFVGRRRFDAGSINSDRRELSAIIAELARRFEGSGEGPRIVIAGAADTGVLATVAHGVIRAGEVTLASSRFTVVDLCRTPLELCEAFGRRHRLDLSTQIRDLAQDGAPLAADIIVVHSLIRFLPPDQTVPVLRRLGGWLSPGGRIVLSVRLVRPDESVRMRELLGVRGREPRRSRAEFAEFDDLVATINEARMPIIAMHSHVREDEVADPNQRDTRRRAMLVLGAPED